MKQGRATQYSPLLSKLAKKAAKRLGATLLFEPDWNVVGQLRYPNGRTRYIRYWSTDLNALGASEVAKDKDYATFFLKKMGYPTAEGKTFFSNEWAKAISSSRTKMAAARYAKELGYPVFVKPNSGSQGRDVSLVYSKQELLRALTTIFIKDPVALIQRPVRGRDYRFLVLDGALVCAYERVPLHVVGNGHASIRELFEKRRRTFRPASGNARIPKNDPRFDARLKRDGYSWPSIPTKGTEVFLLDNANLSAGGYAVEVTDEIHAKWKKLAGKIANDMGLRLCGVDLLIDGDVRKFPEAYVVLEVNASPGLDHYAQIGTKQRRVVENLFERVFTILTRP